MTPPLLITMAFLAFGLGTVGAGQPDGPLLVKITVRDQNDILSMEALDTAIYARLAYDQQQYVLAGIPPSTARALQEQGLHITVLDGETRGASYYLIAGLQDPRLAGLTRQVKILLDDGAQAVARMTPAQANELAEAGFEIVLLDPQPIALHPRSEARISDAVRFEPIVATITSQVDQTSLLQVEKWLTGEESALIGGQTYTITTRHTYSGVPIQKATQFAFEHLSSLGLEVEYDSWADPTNPNVIATKAGLVTPDEIYIISAHLDDLPHGAVAPGADDNASGSAGVLVAADILSRYDFGCTLKFALWTGEEQGLLGSSAWSQWAGSQNLDIVGVLNMDMIAYDSISPARFELHARSWLTDSVAMANLFANVVDTYGLALVPNVKIDNWLGNYSDNGSFWDVGYPAILAIEDRDDFTPYYHTVNDTLSTLNIAYFTEFVRASVATFTHMSGCLIRDGFGSLNGTVTSASISSQKPEGAPIAGASITIEDGMGQSFTATTDNSGYYTRTLPVGTYAVTASAESYQTTVVAHVSVLTDTITTQDLQLEIAPVAVPVITVEPCSLETSQPTNSVVNQDLWLTNSGEIDLSFLLQEHSQTPLGQATDVPWLSFYPSGGFLAPQESAHITLELDTSGLEPGRYHAFLTVESNDPATPCIEIPIGLTVNLWRVHLPLVPRRVWAGSPRPN